MKTRDEVVETVKMMQAYYSMMENKEDEFTERGERKEWAGALNATAAHIMALCWAFDIPHKNKVGCGSREFEMVLGMQRMCVEHRKDVP